MAPKRIALKADSEYLRRAEYEPVAQRHLKVGDEIVVCDRGHVWLVESWDNILGGVCSYCPNSYAKPLEKKPDQYEYREQRRPQISMWIVGLVILVIVIGAVLLFGRATSISPTQNPTAIVLTISSSSPKDISSATPSIQDTPTNTPISTSSNNQSRPEGSVIKNWRLGVSAGGRRIESVQIGYPDGPAIVIVGSIQGDQSDTTDTLDRLIDWYIARPDEIPNAVSLYLIPSINPDGNAHNTRFNDNAVDLNRNWDTFNWEPDAAVPGFPQGKIRAGGKQAFSEPETKALRDLILQLRNSGRQVNVIILHSSVRITKGEVFPGYTREGIHALSADITREIGGILGYSYETEWGDYEPTGEAIGWCAEQGIPAVDVVSLNGKSPALSAMIEVIQAISR